MTEEQRARRKEYHAQWRARNRAHLAAKQAEFRQRHPEARGSSPKRQEYMRAYRAKHRAKLVEYNRRYAREHPETFATQRLKALKDRIGTDPTRSIFEGRFAFLPFPEEWDNLRDESDSGLPAWEILARREEAFV
jgi:hypothetical protein